MTIQAYTLVAFLLLLATARLLPAARPKTPKPA